MTILTETPHELIAVHLAIAIVVHATENETQSTDSICSTSLECVLDFFKHLVGGFALHAEDGVHVGVVSGATDSEPGRKLLVVELIVSVFIVLCEESALLVVWECAAHRLESLSELRVLNCAETVEIEVLEKFSNCFSFIIGSVGALADLFKNNVLDLGEACIVDCNGCALETPAFEDASNEPVLFVNRCDCVAVRVIAVEGLFRDLSTLALCGFSLCKDQLDEVVHHGLRFLLARRHTGVVWGVVLSGDLLDGHRWGTS